jgi:predicted DNA-binding protein (UPF0251 family)
MKKIHGPERKQQVHNEEIQIFHSSTNIIRMIKSHRMRQTRYTVHMGVRRNAYRKSAESLKATNLKLGVHICTVSKWILMTERIGFIIWHSRG